MPRGEAEEDADGDDHITLVLDESVGQVRLPPYESGVGGVRACVEASVVVGESGIG